MTEITNVQGWQKNTMRGQFGPVMDDLNICMVQSLPPRLEHEGPVLTEFDATANSLSIRYNRGGKNFHAQVTKNVNDVLYCKFCTSNSREVAWCSHIHYVLTERADYELYSNLGRFVIPIVPTEGIYCPVHLSAAESRNPSMPHLVRAHMLMENVITKTEEEIVLGYLRRGHFGTVDLRNLFSDWATGQLDNPSYFAPPKCQWPNHDVMAVRSEYTTLSEFSKRFYPSMYGLCPPCMMEHKKSSPDPKSDAPKF